MRHPARLPVPPLRGQLEPPAGAGPPSQNPMDAGLKNLLDVAVLGAADADTAQRLQGEYTLVDELPFDFSRRRMSSARCNTPSAA